jgi:hypothetical protein
MISKSDHELRGVAFTKYNYIKMHENVKVP